MSDIRGWAEMYDETHIALRQAEADRDAYAAVAKAAMEWDDDGTLTEDQAVARIEDALVGRDVPRYRHPARAAV